MSGISTENPYRRALTRLRRTAIMAAVLSALVNILMLTGPIFMLQVYDRVLASGSVATLQTLFAMVVGAFVLLALYDLLRTRIMSRAAYRLDADMAHLAFDRWVREGLMSNGSLARPLSDLAVVRGFLSSPAMLGIFDLPWVPFYIAIVWFVHPWLGMLALAGALFVTALALLNQWLTNGHLSRAMSMDGSESFLIEQVRRNAETVIPLGMMRNVSRHWRQSHRDGLAIGQTGAERGEVFTAVSKAFRLLLQSALLGLGGYLALQQKISPGMIVAASIIAGRALAPIDQVIGQWRNVVRSRDANRRLKATFDEVTSDLAATQLPEPAGYLSVSDLTKRMPGQIAETTRAPALSNLTFELEPGDALGVIGPSASGKTTLARMLVGAWLPDRGEVRLDGATLQQWGPDGAAKHIGYLPQSLELIAGSIRDNIARFDNEATDRDVVAAAQIADVHNMILQLPDGYDTRIGYGGASLSGGQVQRIGLARAVFGTPRFVILDEPNSNLDSEGDEALSKAINHLREQDCTVVVMAHRPSAIAAVNKILVLNQGEVADFGQKSDVLRRATRPATEEAVQRETSLAS